MTFAGRFLEPLADLGPLQLTDGSSSTRIVVSPSRSDKERVSRCGLVYDRGLDYPFLLSETAPASLEDDRSPSSEG